MFRNQNILHLPLVLVSRTAAYFSQEATNEYSLDLEFNNSNEYETFSCFFGPRHRDEKAAERKRIVEHEKCLHAKFMRANLYSHNGKTNFRGIIFLLCNGTKA